MRAPEDVAVDHDGRLLTGLADGRVLRLDRDGDRVEVLADTGGRPLGVEVAADGALIVCDAYRGLLRVDPGTGRVETLVDEYRGERLKLCDNAAVAADAAIYFSDSTRRFTLDTYLGDIIEHSGTGRLLRRDPDGSVEVLLDDLQFANGVALAHDESFVAVAETGAYRVRRLWLTGPRAGQGDYLVENLPGFPDNVTTGTAGRFWIAIPSRRNPLLDWAHRQRPVIRRAMWAMPPRLQPAAQRTAWVIAVDADGSVVHDLQNAGDSYHMVTGVREHDGRLYLGSFVEPAIAELPVPATP